MEMKQTAVLMLSDDYKERFKAEVWQVRNRLMSLLALICDYYAGRLDFTPTCPVSTLRLQQQAMQDYLAVLEARAVMEGVDLDTPPEQHTDKGED